MDEITYPFPNLNGCIVEVWECEYVILFHTLPGMWLFIQAGIKVNPCYKRGPRFSNISELDILMSF